MARIIDDKTFAKLVMLLSKDEKVQLFNALCTSPKVDENEQQKLEKQTAPVAGEQ